MNTSEPNYEQPHALLHVPTETTSSSCSSKDRISNVLALGYKADDGTIVVTDVLCNNFPEMD